MKKLGDGLAALAALMGAGGVVLAAASAHAGGGEFGKTASEFLMWHAAALIGISAAARTSSPRRARGLLSAGSAMALGAILFGVDVAKLGFLGNRLFPFAAPIGGALTILSWLALALVFARTE